MDNRKVGLLIQQLRKEKGWTQKQLGDAMNVSDKTISKWERGLGCPDISLLNELSVILEVQIDQILNGQLQLNEQERGNMKRITFYVCPSCSSIMTGSPGASISCCGRKLAALEAKAAEETHQLIVDMVDDEYYITLQHEMSKAHYIMFAAYVSFDRILLIKLYPEQNAEFRLPLMRKGALYVYCSQHGLFKQDNLPSKRELQERKDTKQQTML